MRFFNRTPFPYGFLPGKVRAPHPSVTLVIKGTFALKPGENAAPAQEQELPTGDLHEDEEIEKPLLYPSDFAYFKPHTDVILRAVCHAPGGMAATQCSVSVGVDRWRKQLRIIGDRFGDSDDPTPFRAMPITYANSLGGPGDTRNPLGKGRVKEPIGKGVHAIRRPNIENQGPGAEPAGFGPIPMMWPQRLSKAGTYGKKWLKERWPWFAEDLDRTFFNAAPADQQLPEYLRGDETVAFENLHPTISRYESRLPGLRLRCFWNEWVEGRLRFREVPLALDTLWAEPENEKLILLWRGVADVRSEKFTEILHVLLVSESVAEAPDPVAPYGEELNSLVAQASRSPASTLLVPEDLPSGLPPTPPPVPEDLLQKIARREPMERADLTGVDLSGQDLHGMSLAGAILARAKLSHANLSEADLSQANMVDADLSGADLRGAKLTEADLAGANLRGADLSHADLSKASAGRTDLREAVLVEMQASQANFRAARMHGSTAHRAIFESADLTGVGLNGVDFSGANLHGASLRQSQGRKTVFAGANLAEARFHEAILSDADFRRSTGPGSVWEGAKLFRANFGAAKLSKAEFSSTYLRKASFLKADLTLARFCEADLEGADLSVVNGFQTTFEKANLTEADLRQSNLFEVEFLDTILTRARLEGADVSGTKLAL